MKFLRGFLKEEEGGIAENTAIVVMILIIVVGVITAIKSNIQSAQTQAGSKLEDARTFTY